LCRLKSHDVLEKPLGLWETIGMSKPQTHEQTEAQKLVDRIEKKQAPQDEPQTHQESESQILVERIEKKASAQRKKRSARTPGQASTPKG
jgi:hypothetical protein